jgi:hypothetical protein
MKSAIGIVTVLIFLLWAAGLAGLLYIIFHFVDKFW